MFSGIPIIGIAGGIGSGKSFVARLFGDLGCAVIDSDAQVRAAYDDPSVRQTLIDWWTDEVFLPDGEINRPAIARKVFSNPDERRRLEAMLHPLVSRARQRQMEKLARENPPVAFIWDTPLLFEAGLNCECDSVVFVDAPAEVRIDRVHRGRGWDPSELRRRENLQWPLDRKREISDYVIENALDAGSAPAQVQTILSRVLEQLQHGASS